MRLAPQLDIRDRALVYTPHETHHYFAQLQAYQVMPEQELFSMTPVILIPGIDQIVSRAEVRVNCAICGEEIINEREIKVQGLNYCRSCIGQGYYREKDMEYAVTMARSHVSTDH